MIEQEAGFEVGTGWRVLDPTNTVTQVQSPRAFFGRSQEADESAAKVGSFSDVGLGLWVVAAEQEDCGRGWNGRQDFSVALWDELDPLRQHQIILVGIRHGGTKTRTEFLGTTECCNFMKS